jgi:hypothetical protein
MVDMGHRDDGARRHAIHRSHHRSDQPARIEKIFSGHFAKTTQALRPVGARQIS